MKQKALIVWGGWDGHQPDKVAATFQKTLAGEGFDVQVSDSLDAFTDPVALKEWDLIVPIWTMGEIDGKLVENVSEAVADGTGLAGCHGGNVRCLPQRGALAVHDRGELGCASWGK